MRRVKDPGHQFSVAVSTFGSISFLLIVDLDADPGGAKTYRPYKSGTLAPRIQLFTSTGVQIKGQES
jgi:hypothetical protein